jgi:hypothetical protein
MNQSLYAHMNNKRKMKKKKKKKKKNEKKEKEKKKKKWYQRETRKKKKKLNFPPSDNTAELLKPSTGKLPWLATFEQHYQVAPWTL